MHIRLNERVSSPADVAALGIKTGDIIAIEPRYRETESGFIVSRFMDNKVSCFVLFEVARRCKQMGLSLPVELYFSNYEEVGHGGAGVFGSAIQDLLVLDMGTVGDGLAGDEYSCSICVKDSSGPYDYQTRKLLVELAEQEEIAYKLDVYPFYSSDGSAALRAGMQARVGLIGPGVAASHGIERAHKDGIEASIRLTMAYCKHIANSIK
jgi:putative aminopeptidase FrvX